MALFYVNTVYNYLMMYETGGYDGNNFLSSIECYNISEGRWTEEGNMACGRSGHGVAVSTEPSHEYAFYTVFVLYQSGKKVKYVNLYSASSWSISRKSAMISASQPDS